MMLVISKLFLAWATPLVLGITIIYNFSRQRAIPFLLVLAGGYGLGFGVLGQWMLILSIFKIPFSFWSIGTPMLFGAVVFTVIYFVSRLRDKSSPPFLASHRLSENEKKKRDFLLYFLGALILYHVGYVFWRALNVPVIEWDAITTIALKAKIFFFEKTLYEHRYLPHTIYPLQIPFVLVWIATCLGEWSERWVNIAFPFTFAFYLVVHYYFLKNFTSQKWAWFGLVLLISSNFFIHQATIAYRDFTLLFYNCSTIAFLLMWSKSKQRISLILAAFFSGFTTFTKLEGSVYLLVHTAVFIFIMAHQKAPKRDTVKNIVDFVIPSYGICLFYHIYKIVAHISGATQEFYFDFTIQSLSRIPIIIEKICSNLFLSGNWNVVWFLFGLSLLRLRKVKHLLEVKLVLFALSAYFGFYFLVALFTPNYISIAGVESPFVLSRIILHFFPLASMAIILINYNSRVKNST